MPGKIRRQFRGEPARFRPLDQHRVRADVIGPFRQSGEARFAAVGPGEAGQGPLPLERQHAEPRRHRVKSPRRQTEAALADGGDPRRQSGRVQPQIVIAVGGVPGHRPARAPNSGRRVVTQTHLGQHADGLHRTPPAFDPPVERRGRRPQSGRDFRGSRFKKELHQRVVGVNFAVRPKHQIELGRRRRSGDQRGPVVFPIGEPRKGPRAKEEPQNRPAGTERARDPRENGLRVEIPWFHGSRRIILTTE